MIQASGVTESADDDLGPLSAGQRLGDYTVEAFIAEGGMGVIYRAVRIDGRRVALKVMKRELSENGDFRRRFSQEAAAARSVSNPHVVPVLDEGEAGGHCYLVMRYVDGRSLADEVAEGGPMDLERLVYVSISAASGLDALHDAEILHRDVKPSNILVDAGGTVALTDFGLAKGRTWAALTKTTDVVGSIQYLPPERIAGEPASPASDIYSFGCTVFECIAGAPPFGGQSEMRVAFSHMESVPPDPCAGRLDMPRGLSEVVLRALEKDPALRPRRAGDYAESIRAIAEGPGR
ncbi:MAG: serine/threonine-protein kinase [Actinomycetota bacterium]